MMITPRANPYPAAAVGAAVLYALVAANDRPNPVEDANRTPEKHARRAQDFRRSAWKHLAENDLPQASIEAWALVAETVKAVSAQHGGIIHSHRATVEVISELAQVADDAGDTAIAHWIGSSFATARGLHTNFYEDELRDNTVRGGLRQCEQLAEQLLALFGLPSPSSDGNAGDDAPGGSG